MDAAGEIVGDDQDSRIHHQEMKSLGLQQLESLVRVESLLKALVESQINTQPQLSQMVNTTSTTTGADYKNEEEKHNPLPNPSSINPLHQPDTITVAAATDNIPVNMERPSTLNGNQEITQVIPNDVNNDRLEEYDVVKGYEELYKAAENGDWKVASKFLKKNPEAITKVIASDSRTVLHVAIIQGNLMFTEEIVKRMPPEVLEYKTSITGYTALHYAGLCGYTKAAEVLVNKNLKLTQIEDRSRRIPLVLALISVTGRQRGTVEYLYSVTRHEHPSPFCGNQGDSLLRHTIDAGYYDISSSLVQRFPELVIDKTKKVETSAMNNMAERPFAFASGAKYTFWQRRIYSLVKVDINTEYEFDAKPNIKSSDESHTQSLECTNGDEENRVKIFEGSYKAGKKQPVNAENTQGDEEKWSKPKTVAVYMLVPIIIVPYLIFIIIKSLYLFVLRFTPWSPVVKVQRNSYESHPQSLEGIDGDQENPVERFEGCYGDEKNPPENSENTQGEKAKHSIAFTVGYYIIGPIFIVVFIVPYLIYLMIKFFFVSLMRFIWSPGSVNPIQQVRKQFYDDKVKHKQAEALVKIIFATLKDRMSKVEVIDFFGGSNIMKMAIRHGSVEIVEVCIKLFPYLIWTQLSGQTMIQMAIAQRNETILDLLCEESGKNKIDLVSRCGDKDNTILHYAAKLAPPAQLNSVSGAYLQMQREKQWFKGVENMIPEKDRFKRNADGDTAHDIFTKEHKELKESGEKWLKDTSGSCMVVAALIATVSFASAFTVPGGNFSESNSGKIGTPVFLKDNSFIVFAVADALALLSAVTSVLMFLYTSRYAEVDFLKSLPNKLILGLATLFMSMASVLVAFGASLFIVLGDRYRWVLIPIVVVSCVPVTLFGCLQLPLFFDMIRSTYWGSLFREHTYISSLQLNSKEENHYKKLLTFVDGFGNYLEKLVSKKFHRLAIDG